MKFERENVKMEDKYNWNLKDIFKTEEEFRNTQKKIEEKLEETNKTRANLIRKIDKIYPIKCAYQNKEIKYLYSNLLEYPNNLKAKEMLHTNHLEKVKSKL